MRGRDGKVRTYIRRNKTIDDADITVAKDQYPPEPQAWIVRLTGYKTRHKGAVVDVLRSELDVSRRVAREIVGSTPQVLPATFAEREPADKLADKIIDAGGYAEVDEA